MGLRALDISVKLKKNRASTFSNKPNTQTLGFWQSGDHCQKPVGL
jgi:hypothetical protein